MPKFSHIQISFPQKHLDTGAGLGTLAGRVAKSGPPGLPKIETVDDLDELDLEIIAALEENPEVSCREIGERTGKGTTTVWERIRRLRKSDWVESMRRELRSLAPKCVDAINAGVSDGESKDRAAISLRLLDGLGVTEDKRRVAIAFEDATPQQIADALSKMSDDDFNRLMQKRGRPDSAGSGESQEPTT